MLDGKSVLVTGGTGSFGQKFVRTVLQRYKPARLIVFSRDELKQSEMQQEFPLSPTSCMRYFIGDVRDTTRLHRAFSGVDIVVHAAALKQVPACERDPMEAIKTNILGAANIIDAALNQNISTVIALSTDKAANPINLYGATKLCSDRLFLAANTYRGMRPTRFGVVRYGNVVGSRGSVVPLFRRLRDTGELPITDPRMTRFWITLDQGVDFVLKSIERLRDNELFIPKLPSATITDLAKAIAPECAIKVVGIRPQEKIHELLLTEGDARFSVEYDDHFRVISGAGQDELETYARETGGRVCQPDFSYSSETNTEWLDVEAIRAIIGQHAPAPSAPA